MTPNDRSTLWSSGRDESVEVNQRALIDKVLARYSGEFTVFRELLQNSDDAASQAVEVHFESTAYLDRLRQGVHASSMEVPDLKQDVHQWKFRNNGMIFRDEDWSRLKKIAEGNPDEDKIGAFGVGFYSLFSVTEEPFVRSGNEWMGFYWKDKKDQLFARRGSLSSSDTSNTDFYAEWTTFEMPLREPAPMPSAFDFIRFLASSITFMTHLENVTVWLDGKQLAKLSKERGVSKQLPIPKHLRNKSTRQMMLVTGVGLTSLSISAEVLRVVYTSGSQKKPPQPLEAHSQKTPAQTGFFSSLFSSLNVSNQIAPRVISPSPPVESEVLDPISPIMSHLVLSIFTAQMDVRLNQQTSSELHRSMKKNPPNKMKLELIYTGKDEYDASKKDEEVIFAPGSIFQGLRADLDSANFTHIYIGHATGQTTGLGGHISGRFIPTVERESIDLVDRNVAIWNQELLYVAGILARVAYEIEMNNIRDFWNGASESVGDIDATPNNDLRDWLHRRVVHALKFFTYHPSTPSAAVSNFIEAAFFSSSADGSFPMLSTVGVLDARNIRAYNSQYSGFLRQLPILPPDVAIDAKGMVDALRSRGMLKDITFADVLTELSSRALTQQEIIECLKWRINLDTDGVHPTYLAELRREFLRAAVFTIGEGNEEKVIPLATIKTVLIPRNAASFIPTNSPFPEHTLPFSVSKYLKPEALPSLLGWSELTVPIWIENLVSSGVRDSNPEHDLSRSAVWAEKVLNVLARAWPSLSKEDQSQVVALLKTKTCIPTKFGMKQPEEAYFSNANVFPDLPIITMPNNTPIKGNLEKVMTALGVLHHVNLQIVFTRMISTGDWGVPELIRYLVAVEDTLTPLEIDRLRETVAFPKEDHETLDGGPASTNTASGAHASRNRFKASDLYEPSVNFRELKLPIIAWGNSPRWRSSSDEAKFLFKLGLRRQPVLADLLSLAASTDLSVRSAALNYFIKNASSYTEYNPKSFSTIAYVPALRPDGTSIMSKPLEVFTDKEVAVMGFFLVDPNIPADAVFKLKLSRTPPASSLIRILKESPTKDIATARKWFEFLATVDFSSSELHQLSKTAFIPVAPMSSLPGDTGGSQFLEPQKCYLDDGSGNAFHSQLFTFVDFGSRANSFLVACGARREPTVDELAKILVSDPRNFYKLAGGFDKFLVELRNIAINYHGVAVSTRDQMKRSPCLVGSRRVQTTPAASAKRPKNADNLSDDDQGQWEHDLWTPDKIVIVDDTATYTLFASVFSAPQEDILEDFYSGLGSPRLSNLVREDFKLSPEIPSSKLAVETRNLVLERLPLFLYERTHAKAVVSYSWLNNSGHFVVNEVAKLTLIRTLHFGNTKIVKSQEASATAERKSKGPVKLYINGNSEVDLYEVSNSLCRVLLNSHKPNDSLLFMTILSTDLRALKRRGFDVDRILRRQQADLKARKVNEQELMSEAKRIQENKINGIPHESINEQSMDFPENRPGRGFLSNWRQKIQRPMSQSSSRSPPRPSPTPPNPIRKATDDVAEPMKQHGKDTSRNQDLTVTPHANIERNVRNAIEGCKPEKSSVVFSKAQATRIKEAMDEGYCDVMGEINLEQVGYSDGGLKVFISGNVDAKTVSESKKAAINRFGSLILAPLIKLYNIPAASCNIFYDVQGPLIAFNRNGSLFLNLRYYESWHDADVQRGHLSQAYTSWYFSLAHEIAHNLVHPHNSEHEFYFSTICEQHMLLLAALLKSA